MTDISSLMGMGEQTLYCHESSGCEACYKVNNVTIFDDAIQTCYALAVTCDSIVIVGRTWDLGCTNTTDCDDGKN